MTIKLSRLRRKTEAIAMHLQYKLKLTNSRQFEADHFVELFGFGPRMALVSVFDPTISQKPQKIPFYLLKQQLYFLRGSTALVQI